MLKYYNPISGHYAIPACQNKDADGAAGQAGKMKKKSKKNQPKKHRLTVKQKKALKAGRKVLKHLRTGREVAPALEPVIIKEGSFMAKGKKGKHVKHVVYGDPSGLGGKKKYHKKHKYLHGEMGGFDPAMTLADIFGLLLGAITGSAVAGLMPIKNIYLKSFIPLVLGTTAVSIRQVARNRFAQRMGLGALSIGGYSIIKHLIPQLPLLTGADDAEGVARAIEGLPEEERALLGFSPEQPVDTSGGDEYGEGGTDIDGNAPGEMLGDVSMIGANAPGEMLGDVSMIGEDGEDF